MKVHRIVLTALGLAALVGIVAWVLNASSVNHWLAIHTGSTDITGSYYAFWSGFGGDITEFGIVGAAITGLYHLNRKHNCHQQGCWRIGIHHAADKQFLLCTRHHPDYHGKKPTREVIERLHRQHLEREQRRHEWLEQTREHRSEMRDHR